MASQSIYVWFCTDDIDNWLKAAFVSLFFLLLPCPQLFKLQLKRIYFWWS